MKLRGSNVSPRALAEVWLWRHGWAWTLVLLLAGTTTALYVTAWSPQRARLLALNSQVNEARVASHRPPASAGAPAGSAIDARTVIAAAAPADQLVARMIQLAQAEGVALPQSEYQQHLTADSTTLQVQITQPVHASYPQIRRYIEAVLRAVPNASLDQLSARRENVGQPQLEAKLRWSLWLPRPTESQSLPVRERPTP